MSFRNVAGDPLDDFRRVEEAVDVGAQDPAAIADCAIQFGLGIPGQRPQTGARGLLVVTPVWIS